MENVSDNKPGKGETFSWDKFNPDKFFAETDKVAKVLREVREKNGESGKVEFSHEG